MKEDYQHYSDEELMIQLRDGDDGIMDFIMNKYNNLVLSLIKISEPTRLLSIEDAVL